MIYHSTFRIARELTPNMLRTGYSGIIKESRDFTGSCATRDASSAHLRSGYPMRREEKHDAVAWQAVFTVSRVGQPLKAGMR